MPHLAYHLKWNGALINGMHTARWGIPLIGASFHFRWAWGRCWRVLLSESSQRDGYLVGIFHPNTHISLSHTVHSREIWGICKGYVGGWYVGLCLRYGGLLH